MEDRTVSIRARDSKGDLTTLSLQDALDKLTALKESRSLANTLEEEKKE
jgi:threonyl-tRNA synthetase